MTTTTKATIVESRTEPGDYDMQCTTAIIDHPEHGRILLLQGFGGRDTMRGGAIRWEHGAAIRLHDGDTIDSLRAGEWSEAASLWSAVVDGYDDSRPILDWSGHAIASVAASVGL